MLIVMDAFIDIASMILYLLSQLIYGTAPTVIASKCDLGAADVMFVVQSSYDISNDDFEDVKNFLKQYVDDLDIGFHEKQTRVGVVVFDRVHEAQYRIKFDQIEKVARLQKAILSLHRLPCGYWWCRTNPIFTAHKVDSKFIYARTALEISI
uniref:VWFA domain-containing protein n=1 Tax=Ascaris lumbricoides TaxID=6252 RepID=A0A0M3HH79_ASCLU